MTYSSFFIWLLHLLSIVEKLLNTANDLKNNIHVDHQYQYQPRLSTHPKSLFRFNRRYLFQSSPHSLMQYLLKLLELMNIQTWCLLDEPFTIKCSCRTSDWKFLTTASDDSHDKPIDKTPDKHGTTTNSNDNNPLIQHTSNMANGSGVEKDNSNNELIRFTLTIYQARWAGGRLGIKLFEAEEDGSGDTLIFRLLYFMILRCIGNFFDQHIK